MIMYACFKPNGVAVSALGGLVWFGGRLSAFVCLGPSETMLARLVV